MEQLTVPHQSLRRRLPDHETLGSILRETGAVLAGGSVVSLFHDQGIHDLDFYVRSSSARRLLERLMREMHYFVVNTHVAPAYDQSFLRRNQIRSRICLHNNHDRPIDVMIIPDGVDPVEIISNFDLTFCQSWYNGDGFYSLCAEDLRRREGTLTAPYTEALLRYMNRFTLLRIQKYTERGFTIRLSDGRIVRIGRQQQQQKKQQQSQDPIHLSIPHQDVYTARGEPDNKDEWFASSVYEYILKRLMPDQDAAVAWLLENPYEPSIHFRTVLEKLVRQVKTAARYDNGKEVWYLNHFPGYMDGEDERTIVRRVAYPCFRDRLEHEWARRYLVDEHGLISKDYANGLKNDNLNENPLLKFIYPPVNGQDRVAQITALQKNLVPICDYAFRLTLYRLDILKLRFPDDIVRSTTQKIHTLFTLLKDDLPTERRLDEIRGAVLTSLKNLRGQTIQFQSLPGFPDLGDAPEDPTASFEIRLRAFIYSDSNAERIREFIDEAYRPDNRSRIRRIVARLCHEMDVRPKLLEAIFLSKKLEDAHFIFEISALTKLKDARSGKSRAEELGKITRFFRHDEPGFLSLFSGKESRGKLLGLLLPRNKKESFDTIGGLFVVVWMLNVPIQDTDWSTVSDLHLFISTYLIEAFRSPRTVVRRGIVRWLAQAVAGLDEERRRVIWERLHDMTALHHWMKRYDGNAEVFLKKCFMIVALGISILTAFPTVGDAVHKKILQFTLGSDVFGIYLHADASNTVGMSVILGQIHFIVENLRPGMPVLRDIDPIMCMDNNFQAFTVSLVVGIDTSRPFLVAAGEVILDTMKRLRRELGTETVPVERLAQAIPHDLTTAFDRNLIYRDKVVQEVRPLGIQTQKVNAANTTERRRIAFLRELIAALMIDYLQGQDVSLEDLPQQQSKEQRKQQKQQAVPPIVSLQQWLSM